MLDNSAKSAKNGNTEADAAGKCKFNNLFHLKYYIYMYSHTTHYECTKNQTMRDKMICDHRNQAIEYTAALTEKMRL